MLHLRHWEFVDFSEVLTHIISTISGKFTLEHSIFSFVLNIGYLRWKPFDPVRNFPDLGPRFKAGEEAARSQLRKEKMLELAAQRQTATNGNAGTPAKEPVVDEAEVEDVGSEPRDLNWSMVMKRTFEAYIRGETPNMYGEWIQW